jgi:Na+/melibiose symporter-like transporter
MKDVSTLFAGAGILGLGGGQLWTLALAYLAAHTAPERRSIVVSGYLAQEAALRLFGKLMFPPLDWALRLFGVSDELFRWRLEMATCTAFCFYGVFLLCFYGSGMRKADQQLRTRRVVADKEAGDCGGTSTSALRTAAVAPATAAEDDSCSATLLSGGGGGGGSAAASSAAPAASTTTHTAAAAASGTSAPFALVMGVLLCQSCSATIGMVLWPLYVRDRFGWSAPEYAWLILLSSSASIAAVSSFPRLAERYGTHRVGVGACVAAAISSFGFCTGAGASGELAWLVHVVLAVVFIANAALLEPCIKSIASQYSRAGAQGRSFGTMAMVAGAGSIFGNLVGTRMYKVGKHSESASAAFGAVLAPASAAAGTSQRAATNGGISLPFIFASALFGVSAALLVAITKMHSKGPGAENDNHEQPQQVELTSLVPRQIDHPDFSSRVASPAALRSRRKSKSPLRRVVGSGDGNAV